MGLRHPAARHSADHRRRRGWRAPGVFAVVLAALTLVSPLPARALAAWRSAYAAAQPAVSAVSARLPVAALDLLLVSLCALALWGMWRRRRAAGRLPAAARALVVAAALLWLVFLAAWGWHYQVPTLEARLGIGPDQLTTPEGQAFARATVRALNSLHASAHAQPWTSRSDLPAALGPHLARVLAPLGVGWTPYWPVPRHTLLDPYFRAAGIDGMTNPFGLDILLNSRVLPVELPALAAHEYAHLAGFADESDASVVAWLACQGGPPALQYSSALAVLPHLLSGLPAAAQREVLSGLGEGPRHDIRAIAARLDEQRPWVHAVAWQTYDRFLKANRVREGVARYDAVARVLIDAADPVTGRLRRQPAPWPDRTAR